MTPTQDNWEQHALSRTRMFELVRKYWLLVLTVFLTGTVAMYLILQVAFTDIYEANTRLLVKVGRENVETPPTVRNGQVFSQGVRAADITSEVQILSSEVLLERVVKQLGPDRFKSVLVPPDSWLGYPKYFAKRIAREVKDVYKETLILLALDKRLTPEQEAVLRLVDGTKVEPVKDSDILILRVQTPSPQLCMDVTAALLTLYLQERMEIRRTPAGSSFFESRVKEASERLNQTQKARAAVRKRWNLSVPDEQRSMYLKQLNTLETELLQNEAELARLIRQRDAMAERFKAMPDLVLKEQVEAPNPVIQSIQERLTALQLERAKVSSRYQPESEMMTKIDSEIRDLEAALAREKLTIINSKTTETNPARREFGTGMELQGVQMAGIEGKTNYLRRPKTELSDRLRGVDIGADEAEVAEREYKRAEEGYLFYAKRLEEARMSEELDTERVANVAVVEGAATPILPVAPKKRFLMGIAMAVFLVLGIALAALVETTDDRIVDERGVLAAGDLAYLGTIELGGRR